MFRKVRFVIFFIFVPLYSLLAQSGTPSTYSQNAPYSQFGLGEPVMGGSIRNIGMGGTGISHSHPDFLNMMNPALLINKKTHHYDSLLSTLDGSMITGLRVIRDNKAKQTSGSVNFNSFAYTLPVTSRWTSAIALRPYTNVSYIFSVKSPIAGSSTDTAMISYSGSGGTYQFEFANAYRINRYINAGLSLSYLWGSIYHTSSGMIINSDSISADISSKYFTTGYLIRPGLAFRKPLGHSESPDSTVFLNIGATYDLHTGMAVLNDQVLERKYVGHQSIVTYTNTILSRNTISGDRTKFSLPGIFRAGVSFDKTSRWNVAADFSYASAGSFRGFAQTDTVRNSFSIALGGELGFVRWKERRENETIKNLRRQYVRAGLRFSQTPMYIHGHQIKDVALTLGYSLPVGKLKGNALSRPKINLAVIFGQQGTLKSLLIKDQYVKAYIGLTLNDKWFRRRRVD